MEVFLPGEGLTMVLISTQGRDPIGSFPGQWEGFCSFSHQGRD